MAGAEAMDGILLLDKPEGVTSAGAIRALRRRLAGSKVGHLGTLDPFASGLLPLCLGEATKIARYLIAEDKVYAGLIRLGVETDTLDRTGRPLATRPVPPLDPGTLEVLARRFTGRLLQTPPMYSAIKRQGVPLYRLARRGVEVERAAREVHIERLELLPAGPDRLAFEVVCSKGTYIRVLAADLGREIGCGAHLESLRRTGCGRFRIEDAVGLDALLAAPSGAPLPLLGIRAVLADRRHFSLRPADEVRLRSGQQEVLAALPPPRVAAEMALVLGAGGVPLALIEARPPAGRTWRLARLLVGAGTRKGASFTRPKRYVSSVDNKESE